MACDGAGAANPAFVVKFLFVCGIRLLHLFAAPHRGTAAQENLLKNFSLILTLSGLLAATGTAWSAPADANTVTATTEGLPKVALSEELMYKFLSAELANQRGEHFAAYATMLSIARSSGDPRLARRALEFAAAGSLAPEALKAARLWRELALASGGACETLGHGQHAPEALARLTERMRGLVPMQTGLEVVGAQLLQTRSGPIMMATLASGGTPLVWAAPSSALM